MAIQEMELDPNAGGVSVATFDAHTHNYRRLDTIGIDLSKKWLAPEYEVVVDDSMVYVTAGNDAEAVGVEVSTKPTSTPV